MTHNPFLCLWNRWILPFFVQGSFLQGLKPAFDELDNDEKDVLIEYIYDGHNLDDFYDWLRQNYHSKHCSGAQIWGLRFSKGKHELVSAPMVGPVFYVVVALIYGGIGLTALVLAYAAILGFRQIFSI